MSERASNESYKMLTSWMRADAELETPKIDDAIGIEIYGETPVVEQPEETETDNA